MKNKYLDLIEQTFDFPTEEFKVEDSELFFNNIPLIEVIKQYGTPLRVTFLIQCGYCQVGLQRQL